MKNGGRPFASLIRIHLLALSLSAAASLSHAADITDPQFWVTLSAPAPWHTDSENQNLVPSEEELKKAKLKKIHIVNPTGNPNSLEEAMNQEMDSIDARNAETSRRPTSNGRRGFSGSHPVETTSGIVGLCAEFAQKSDEKIYYGITKYYFRHKDGRIFKICAHIYGDQTTADEYEKIILSELRYVTP